MKSLERKTSNEDNKTVANQNVVQVVHVSVSISDEFSDQELAIFLGELNILRDDDREEHSIDAIAHFVVCHNRLPSMEWSYKSKAFSIWSPMFLCKNSIKKTFGHFSSRKN